MTLRLYQTGLQVVVKNETTKYDLYQTGLQVVVRRKNPVYDLYQAGLQIALRRLDMPQHAQYSIYELPVEVVYEPAPETIQFSHCLEPGYFFAVDHFAELLDGETLIVRVWGGVPPYTWSLDVGSVLSLSATETDDPYVTLSITGVFAVGTEELTVEDACGSQATICVYLCNGYDVTSYTCSDSFSCDEYCRRTVVPIEPPIPPLPPPPEPPEPPEPPQAPHETEVYTVEELVALESLNLLIVSFWHDPSNTEVRFLWDLDQEVAYDFVTKAEYDVKYSVLAPIEWLNDLQVIGDAPIKGSLNYWNADGGSLTISDFGYPVTEDYEWGCGNTFTRADFAPLWCEDSETICYGRCGGVNWGDDYFDECTLMPPWDELEVTRYGYTHRGWKCEFDLDSYGWPAELSFMEAVSHYSYKSFLSQFILGWLYFFVGWLTCPPWSYAKLNDSDVTVVGLDTKRSLIVSDTSIGENEDHGYPSSYVEYSDSGDWGTRVLEPATEAEFDSYSYIRTSYQYSVSEISNSSDLYDNTTSGCESFPKGSTGPFVRDREPIVELVRFEYFTHWGRIGDVFIPSWGKSRGEESGHRKIKVVANANVQCQIFLHQCSETQTYISGSVERKYDFHGTVLTDTLASMEPRLAPRHSGFEQALGHLFEMYYTENDYDSDEDPMASKIDAGLQLRVGITSVASAVKLFELPLEVVYERS